MFEFFWTEVLGKPDSEAHIIKYFTTVETPQGTEGEIYFAYCGEDQQSWWGANWGFAYGFGDLEEVMKKGIPICSVCQGGGINEELAKRISGYLRGNEGKE
jgi:hypothetical protein